MTEWVEMREEMALRPRQSGMMAHAHTHALVIELLEGDRQLPQKRRLHMPRYSVLVPREHACNACNGRGLTKGRSLGGLVHSV